MGQLSTDALGWVDQMTLVGKDRSEATKRWEALSEAADTLRQVIETMDNLSDRLQDNKITAPEVWHDLDHCTATLAGRLKKIEGEIAVARHNSELCGAAAEAEARLEAAALPNAEEVQVAGLQLERECRAARKRTRDYAGLFTGGRA